MKRPEALAAMLALAALAACDQTAELAPDAGVLRAVHAIPELDALSFTLDDDLLGDFNYGEIRGINRPGDSRHDVLIDVKLPDPDEPTRRLETLAIRTAVDLEQTLVLTGTLAAPEVITWEQPARDWAAEQSDGEITVLEVSFGHGAPSRGALDLYLGPEDFDPAAAAPMASLSYGALATAVEIDAGEYELVVTPAGDAATELFRTSTLELPAATSLLFVAFDSHEVDGGGAARLRVRSLGSGLSQIFADVTAPASLRVMHAAPGTGAIDARTGANDDVLVGGVEYGTASPYVESATGTVALTITPVADPDTELAIVNVPQAAGAETTVVVHVSADDIAGTSVLDDTRRIVTHGRFRAINVSDTSFVDVYRVEPDASIEDEVPSVAALLSLTASGYFAVPAGEHDLVVTASGQKTIAGGPLRVLLEASGLYGIAVVTGDEEGTLELLLLDDLAAGGGS
jgi:hypothetical protein